MNDDRAHTTVALLSTVVAGLIAWSHPSSIPALALAFAAWVTVSAYLRL